MSATTQASSHSLDMTDKIQQASPIHSQMPCGSCVLEAPGGASLQVGMKPDVQSGPMDIQRAGGLLAEWTPRRSAVLDTLQVTRECSQGAEASEAGFLLF